MITGWSEVVELQAFIHGRGTQAVHRVSVRGRYAIAIQIHALSF